MFLLDTNVVSELRKKQCDRNVANWILANNRYKLFISVVTFYEIRRGICAQERRNPVFASALSEWLLALKRNFYGKILPVSEAIADEWGRISYLVRNNSVDNMIAATAKIHQLTIVTRNVRHFELTGVSCVNPWENP